MGILLWMAAVALVATGIAGTVLPALPGPVLVFGGLLLAAWAEEFRHVGVGVLILLAALTAIAHVVDLAASALGASRAGASKRAVLGAALGLLAGFLAGPPGFILGPFLGAFLAELTVRRDMSGAGRAGLGAGIGVLVGTMTKLALVFVMIGIFLLARLF